MTQTKNLWEGFVDDVFASTTGVFSVGAAFVRLNERTGVFFPRPIAYMFCCNEKPRNIASMRFKDIPGQESAKAAAMGAVARGRLSHAILLVGPEGTGKLAFAAALVQRLFCSSPSPDGDSCGVCDDCRKVSQGGHPDVHYVFPYARSHDAKASNEETYIAFREARLKNPFLTLKQWAAAFDAENKQLVIGVEEARALKRALTLSAFEGKGKAAVVWRADMLNVSAANALLKLLEEPTDQTTLVLTAENPSDVLPTIYSRCQKLTFFPVKAEIIARYLESKGWATADKAQEAAALAGGSVAKAMEILRQADEPMLAVFRDWLNVCYKGAWPEIERWVKGLTERPREFQKLYLTYGLEKLREALWTGLSLPATTAPQERELVQKFARMLDVERIETAARMLEDAVFRITRNANAKMTFVLLTLKFHQLLRAGR